MMMQGAPIEILFRIGVHLGDYKPLRSNYGLFFSGISFLVSDMHLCED